MSTSIICFTSPRQQYSVVNFHGRFHHHVFGVGGLSCLPSKPFSANQTPFQNINLNRVVLQPKSTTTRKVNATNNLPDGNSLPNSSPPGPNPPSGWSPSWLLWTLIPMLLPFLRNKWGPLLEIKKNINTAIETVECATEVIEDVAKKMEEVVEDIEEKLPEDSELKDKLRVIEHATEEAIKGADLAEDFIHKAREAEKKMENLMEQVDHEGTIVVPKESGEKKDS